MSGVTVNIGVYQNETDWSQFDGNMAKARKHEGLVHQVYYVNGDKCDLTGKPRQAVAKVGGRLGGDGACLWDLLGVKCLICGVSLGVMAARGLFQYACQAAQPRRMGAHGTSLLRL